MKDKLSIWISNLHMVLILLAAIPLLFNIDREASIALIPIGLIILIQCFQYASTPYNTQEFDYKDNAIYNWCTVVKIALFTLYLAMTGYWIVSPLYYVIINPKNNAESRISLLMTIFGVLLVWAPKLKSVDELPWFLLALVAVLSVTILIHVSEKAVSQIIQREYKLEEQMKATALNELKIKNLNRELAMKYQLADTNARLEERENMARNIHNVVGHTITSAIVSLQAYNILKDEEPQRAEEKLSAATDRMHLSLEEIRRAVRVLDQETQDMELKDFAQLLITELKRFSMDTDIEVSHNLDYLDLDRAIDKRYCEFMHSALTECLNNGIRYGKATSFFVFIQSDINHIELSVSDNGLGFGDFTKDEQDRRIRQGYGIRKMEQFLLEHGGKMRILSENGFSIHMELPLW